MLRQHVDAVIDQRMQRNDPLVSQRLVHRELRSLPVPPGLRVQGAAGWRDLDQALKAVHASL